MIRTSGSSATALSLASSPRANQSSTPSGAPVGWGGEPSARQRRKRSSAARTQRPASGSLTAEIQATDSTWTGWMAKTSAPPAAAAELPSSPASSLKTTTVAPRCSASETAWKPVGSPPPTRLPAYSATVDSGRQYPTPAAASPSTKPQ